MALHKLPKSYSSDFRLPNKKPVGDVEIDPRHPLAKYVNSLIMYGMDDGAVAGDSAEIKTKGGLGYSVDSLVATSPWAFPKQNSVSTLEGGYSVFTLFHQSVFRSPANVIYCERPTGSQIFKFQVSTSGFSYVIRNAAGGGLVFSTPVQFDLSKNIHSVMFVKQSDSLRTVYADNNSGTETSNSGGTYNATTPVLCSDPLDNGQASPESNILITITFNKALTKRDYNLLKSSPYQILKPKQAPIYFTSDAGGVPTLYPSFIPSAEEFYTASVENMLSVVEPNFITTQESIYNPEVSPQGVTILPDYIPSEEVVYSPTVADLLQVLSPDFIPTEETVYSPEVERLLQLLYPSYIESEETTYNPTVTGGDSISIPLTDRRTWNAVAQYLRDLVFTGQDNDVIQKWFISEGYEGEYNENWNSYLADQGYTDGNLSDRYSAWRKQ